MRICLLRLISSLFILSILIPNISAQVNNNQQASLNCVTAYQQLVGAANATQRAANALTSSFNRASQIDRNANNRLQLFSQQEQQIALNRDFALTNNRTNAGGCLFRSVLFGGRIVNCAPFSIQNGINIRNNFDNQLRFLALNRDNFIRATQNTQRFLAKTIETQNTFFVNQRQVCFDAEARAANCSLRLNQIPPNYPAVACNIEPQPPTF